MDCRYTGKCSKPCSLNYVNRHKGAYIIGTVLMFFGLASLTSGLVFFVLGVVDIKFFAIGLGLVILFMISATILETDYFKPITEFHSCRSDAVQCELNHINYRLDKVREELKKLS